MNRSDITDAELLAALVPDSPACLTSPQDAAGRAPQGRQTAAQSLPEGPLAVAYQTRPDGSLAPFYVPVPVPQSLPAVRHDAGPLVPRWALGAAVTSVGVGGGVFLLAKALDILGGAASALAAGASAALPWLVIAGVVIASVVGRKKTRGGGVSVVQTITQTITQSVHTGE